MKNLILIFTLISLTLNAFAQSPVILISPLVQLEERYLPLELDKNYKPYSQYYLENFPKEKNVETLLNEFESAQKYYLVKSYEIARQYYEKVISFCDMDEWRDVHRKIIFLSYIRLSELNKQNQREWILSALKFSLDTDPAKLDITKETLKKIVEAKKSFLTETLNWQVDAFKKEFSHILINGHVIDLKKIETVRIPAGKFRITFLSDIYKPQTYQVSSQQIPLLIPTRIPFLSGSCEKPFFNNEGETPMEVVAYFSKDCVKHQLGTSWLTKEDLKNKNFISQETLPTISTSFTPYRIEPFYKTTWFKVTLGIVAAATIYAIDKSNEKKPTHETVNGL